MFKVVHNRLGDANSGAGYGTTKTKFSGKSYPAPATYPYDVVEKDNDIFDEIESEISGKVLVKTGMSSIAKDASQGRYDRSSFTKGRLDLAENLSEETTIKQGISPFPFSTLYKNFDGPAVGGFKTNFAYRTGPGRSLNATTRGWSQAPDFNPIGDKIRIEDIFDSIDPDKRTLAKANLMIKLAQKDEE